MKLLSALLMSFALAACGGGGGDNGITVTDGGVLTLTESNQTVRIDRTDEYTVLVPSSMNKVTIATHNKLSQLGVTGANNNIVLEDDVAVRALSLNGSNNALTLSSNDSIPELDILGSNATVSIGPGSKVNRLLISGGNALVTIQSMTSTVPVIQMTGSNTVLRVPTGYLSSTTITNTGANNQVIEQ